MQTLGDVITALIILAALIVVPYKLAKAWLWPYVQPLIMSRLGWAPKEKGGEKAVHVPIQGTAVVSAKPPSDRNIIIDAWIVALADARDEKGGDLFSANDIFKAVGGHRAAVLARVKAIRSGVPPAQFRQEDGATAPADYPVTRSA